MTSDQEDSKERMDPKVLKGKLDRLDKKVETEQRETVERKDY